MRHLLISQKLMFVAVAVSLPIIVLTYLFVAERNQAIVFTHAELDGTQYLRRVRKLAADVATHRDLAAAVLAGDGSFKPDLAKTAAAIDEDFRLVAAQQASTELASAETLAIVLRDWETIKKDVSGYGAEQSFEQHSRYLAKLLQFMALIANDSNLVLDSEVETHYLIDALVFHLPKLTSEVSAARAYGLALYGADAQQSDLRLTSRGALAATTVKIDDALLAINHFMRFAAGKDHPRTEAALAGALAADTKAANDYINALGERVINGGEPMTTRQYFTIASAPLDAAGRLWDATVVELDRLLEERNAALQSTIEIEVLVVGLTMLLTVGFLYLVARTITRPIKHLSDVADKISLGDMDAVIKIDSRDEIGQLGERFRRMQESLKQAMDALEKQSTA